MLNTTKKCSSCKTIKILSKYGKHKRMKDGFRSSCKECEALCAKKYKRSKEGVLAHIYSHQRLSSRTRGHDMPTYDLRWMRLWAMSTQEFNTLFIEWEQSGYLKKMIPSIDRIDDSIGYTHDNIQIMSWGDNEAKSNLDMREGRLMHGNNPQKKVEQFTMDNIFIKEFPSASHAGRITTAAQGGISLCCRGKRNHSGGFIWRFA